MAIMTSLILFLVILGSIIAQGLGLDPKLILDGLVYLSSAMIISQFLFTTFVVMPALKKQINHLNHLNQKEE